jgi:hypothetical protein
MTSTPVAGSGEIQNPGSLTGIMTGNISFHLCNGYISANLKELKALPLLCQGGFLR